MNLREIPKPTYLDPLEEIFDMAQKYEWSYQKLKHILENPELRKKELT